MIEFTSTAQALTWFFFYAIWIFFLFSVFMVKGDKNKTITLFNLFQCFVGIVIGLGFLNFSFVIGFLTIVTAVAVFVGKSVMGY